MAPDYTTSCELLDKLTLQSLHLMEDKLEREISLESAMDEGSIHLAKSRYIMGQSTVSSLRLPTEDSPEFTASIVCVREESKGDTRLQISESKSEGTINPIKWFGVLVPQNLHKAQGIFRSALDYVVDCTNTQIKLAETLNDIELLAKAVDKMKP